LFQRLTTAVSNVVTTVTTAVQHTVSTVSNTVSRAVTTASTAVRDAVSTTANRAAALVDELAVEARQIGRSVATTVSQAAAAVGNTVRTMAQSVGNTARSAGSSAVSIVRTEAERAAESVSNTARNVAVSVLTAAREAVAAARMIVQRIATHSPQPRFDEEVSPNILEVNSNTSSTPTPPGSTPTATSTPTVASIPVAPTVQATPTAEELAARFAEAKELRMWQAAVNEQRAAVNEQRAFNADPLAFVLAEAVPYYDELLREIYDTTLADLVAPPRPANNPISEDEIHPGLVPSVVTGLGGANPLFLVSLELDPAHYPNYDPVYLNALRETYPDFYLDAVASKEEDAGAGDLFLRFVKFLPYD
jgi:hypothetical protein